MAGFSFQIFLLIVPELEICGQHRIYMAGTSYLEGNVLVQIRFPAKRERQAFGRETDLEKHVA